MAPKKKGKADKGEEVDDASQEKKPEGPTLKELQLKEELTNLTASLDLMKKQVEDLIQAIDKALPVSLFDGPRRHMRLKSRSENDWLQQEAQETRIESHEYMSYMTKKTQKRQTAIVSLSDQNAFEIQQINNQKTQMLKDFDDKKTALQEEILSKEADLAAAKRDLEYLKEYQILQREQEAEIARLEKEVYDMRSKHSDAVQKLKTKFITEKCAFQKESDTKIGEMAKEANMEAQRCLQDHTWRIKEENRSLRKELLGLIQQTRVLHQHKKQLDEQHKILQREKQYANNLQSLRAKRQDEMYETFGLKVEHDSLENVD